MSILNVVLLLEGAERVAVGVQDLLVLEFMPVGTSEDHGLHGVQVTLPQANLL